MRHEASVVVYHRCEMFLEMGTLQRGDYGNLLAKSLRFFESAMLSGEYVGFLASPVEDPETFLGGGGVLLRPLPPRPIADCEGILGGRQGLIMNVYVERDWRGKGIATQILESILTWLDDQGIRSVVLHASEAGRSIYEKRGFRQSNEMSIILSAETTEDGY